VSSVTPEQTASSGSGIEAMLPYRYAPRPTSGHTVVRKELLRNLTEATLIKQLSIVRGPAGSGKTTLLAQWRGVCEDMGRPVAWLTVDEADQELSRFVSGLATAFEKAGCTDVAHGFRQIRADVLRGSAIHVAQHLAAVCNRTETRFVLVLDQYEVVDGRIAGEVLSGFLNHAVNVRLLAASRQRLTIPLGALRARDQIFEIGPSDLNLTPLETHELFAGVPELYTRKLHYETSGEAVAVGFARRVLDVSARDLVGAGSWQDQLNEYYRAEVLETLPPEMREAMSRLVVVERFDLSLATALIGRNATELVERLHHTDGLLLRRRGTPEFYFSEMLRRFLETRLAWQADDEHRALHRRAAIWFAGRGRNAEALRHAIEAGDRDHALRLLDRVGYQNLVVQYGVSAAHQLLEAVGVAPQGAPVGQLLSLAVVYAHEGNLEQAEICLEEVKRTGLADVVAGSALTDQLALAETIVVSLRDDTQHANTVPALTRYLATGPKGDHEGRALALILLSWDRYCRGDIDGAQTLATAAEQEYGETEGIYGSLFMHLHRVLDRFWRNDLERALQEITLAEQMTRLFFPNDQRLCAMTGVVRAGLLFELGRPDPLTDMTELVGIVGAIEQWSEMQIWSHSQAARAALSQGAPSEARGIIAYGSEMAKRLNSPRLQWALSLLSIEVSLRLNELERAAEEATALGILDAERLDDVPFLTWQERISGALISARLAESNGDLDRAEALVELAAARIAQTCGATRLHVQLEIARARLSYRRGDSQASAGHFAAARALCGGGLPVRLFLDGGDGLHASQPELSRATLEVRPTLRVAPETAISMHDDPLTARERQILLILGEGHQNKVVAHRLGLSEATVKFHLRNIYRKLRAQNRTQALARYRSLVDV